MVEEHGRGGEEGNGKDAPFQDDEGDYVGGSNGRVRQSHSHSHLAEGWEGKR